MDVNCTIPVSILDAHEIRHKKMVQSSGVPKSRTKMTHEELDGIDLEGYASHLSNQTHFHKAKVCRKTYRANPQFLSALSDVVVVSKVSKFVRLPTLVTYGAQWQ
jgi:hypothetical protein